MIGLVLAGGKSSRFGSDKAFYIMDGKALWKRQYELLSEICEECVISCNEEQASKLERENLLIDKEQFEGPLHPILECFKNHKQDILVLACDLPFIEASDLKKLTEKNEKTKLRLLSTPGGRHQPLAALWAGSSFPKLQNYYEKGGRKVMEFADLLGFESIICQDTHLRNINYEADLP